MLGISGLFSSSNLVKQAKAPIVSDAIMVGDYVGTLGDGEASTYTMNSRAGNAKIVRVDVLPNFISYLKRGEEVFRHGIIGHCDGKFPVTNPVKDNIYFNSSDNKYYKCKTSFSGTVATPDEVKFEELSLENIVKNVLVSSVNITGAAKGNGVNDGKGNIVVNTTVNYNDITGKPVSLPNPQILTISLNGTTTEYKGDAAKTVTITAAAIGAQPAGNYSVVGHDHTAEDISGLPTTLPNPNDLVIKLNGVSSLTYSGKSAGEINITPSSIGAQPAGNYAPNNHNHDNVYSKLSHKHNSGEVTAMTGYTKAASVSAITVTDTLNVAIGKLEKALDGKQASGNYASSNHNHDDRYSKIGNIKVENGTSNKINLLSSDSKVTGYIGVTNNDSNGNDIRFISASNNGVVGLVDKTDETSVILSANNTTKDSISKINISDVKGIEMYTGSGSLSPNSSISILKNELSLVSDTFNGNFKTINLNNVSQFKVDTLQHTSHDIITQLNELNNHNHDDLYQPKGNYALVDHKHSNYQAIGELKTKFVSTDNPNLLELKDYQDVVIGRLRINGDTSSTKNIKQIGITTNSNGAAIGLLENSSNNVNQVSLSCDNSTSSTYTTDAVLSCNENTGGSFVVTIGNTNRKSILNINENQVIVSSDMLSLSTSNISVQALKHSSKNIITQLNELYEHNHNDQYNTKSEITNLLSNKLGKTDTAEAAKKFDSNRVVSFRGGVAGYAEWDGSTNLEMALTVNTFDASKITSGVIDVDRLPRSAFHDFVLVKDRSDRLALTTVQVQNGDTVKEIDTNKMFLVVNDKHLGEDIAFQEYTTVVDWSTITGKPSVFTPSSHTHDWDDITNRPLSMVNPYGLTISLNGKSQPVYTGSSAVSVNITPASIGAQPSGSYANASHTHDDRYFTETEINSKLGGYSLTSHNHDGVYQPKGSYAQAGHNHDSSYIRSWSVGSINSEATLNAATVPGFYQVNDYKINGLYGWGFLYVTKNGNILCQYYVSHSGGSCYRQTWDNDISTATWITQWDTTNFNPNTKLNTSGGTISGALTVTGQILSNADVVAYSDARVKTNVVKIDSALDKVSAINGYTYDMQGVDFKGKRQAGVIAQELKEVLPEAVVTDDNGYYAVRYTNIIPLLIEALKEERSKRESLEERLAKIERMLDIK